MIRFSGVYSDDEIRAIAAESGDDVDAAMLENKKIGRYGIAIKSSSNSPTAQYADFMAMLEIARMYPDRIPPEVVIESSNLANKEAIVAKISSASGSTETQGAKRGKPKKRFDTSRDFVNTVSRPD